MARSFPWGDSYRERLHRSVIFNPVGAALMAARAGSAAHQLKRKRAGW
nr:MAG TPA: hypothetical protein [Caudoviricetes sp.]